MSQITTETLGALVCVCVCVCVCVREREREREREKEETKECVHAWRTQSLVSFLHLAVLGIVTDSGAGSVIPFYLMKGFCVSTVELSAVLTALDYIRNIRLTILNCLKC